MKQPHFLYTVNGTVLLTIACAIFAYLVASNVYDVMDYLGRFGKLLGGGN